MSKLVGKIELWSGTLADLESDHQRYLSFLNVAERHRMQHYLCPERGKMFAFIRGWLRAVLAHYSEDDPTCLQISYAEHGKPVLTKEQMKPPSERLEFNLSHSGDRFMLAVTQGSRIGLDLEQMRTITEMETMAQMYFSAAAVRELRELKDEYRKRLRFFELWTQLEARYKWLGCAQTSYLGRHPPYSRTWQVAAGYIASLVTDRKDDLLTLVAAERIAEAW